ncbi:hypothetical protein Tco_0284757, partial [Tanacetum coccineum]
TVMSDFEDSTVTYTVVSSPFADLPDIKSPGVDGPPMMPEDLYAYVVAAFQAPPSPDYVPSPEYPPSPEFVPEPVYPKFMPLEDEILLAEEQPLPAVVSPTADSSGYVSESDPKEDDEDPADGGDDGDDEDESSDDDEDDDVDIEGDFKHCIHTKGFSRDIYTYTTYTVMSDFEDSTVTYTAVSSPFADLPDIGSPGVNGPPVMPEDPYAYVIAAFQAPPSPDYVSGPEYPPSPEFVLEPVYPEFMPLQDEILPAEEQPLPAADSPTADSPGYIPESDPEEDPEEDDDEDPREDPADYPANGGDDGDDEDEPSDDDEDEKVDIEAPSAEETEPFETDESAATPPPHPANNVTARISIRDETPISLPLREEIPSPPLPPILSPLPKIPSPPLLVSSPVPVLSSSPPASPIRPLGYRAAMIWLKVEDASTSHSLPLPPPIILSHTRPDAPSSGTPPLHLLSTDRRADRPEVTLPPRKRLGIALGPRYEVRESLSAAAARPNGGLRADYGFVATMDREIMQDLERDVGYGITDTWDEMLVDMPGAPATDDTEMGRRMT